MNQRFDSHLLWGSHSPLSALTGAGLVILASTRFAYALICTGALFWIYGLTALIFSSARGIMPKQGRMAVLLFLSAFLCGLFMLLTGLLNPLLVLSTGFFLVLIPPCFLGSGFFEASETEYPVEVFSRAIFEALVISALILALALVREPLGMGVISFPGGVQGIIELFGSNDDEAFVPVRLLSAAGGGLLLLGYVTALFRYFRQRSGSVPGDGS